MVTTTWLAPVLVILSAPPPAGSSWRWSVERSMSGSAKAKLDGETRHYSTRPLGLHLATLALKVLEVGATAPKRVEVTVLSGPMGVRGRTWLFEEDSGEARMSVPQGAAPTELEEALAQFDPLIIQDLRSLVAQSFRPDPFVTAVADGPPCAKETLERVAAAAGEFVRASRVITTSDVTFEKASARCVGKGGRYAVATTARVLQGSGVLVLPFSGTVDVAGRAWLPNVDLSAAFQFQPDGSRVAFKANGKVRLKSSLEKK